MITPCKASGTVIIRTLALLHSYPNPKHLLLQCASSLTLNQLHQIHAILLTNPHPSSPLTQSNPLSQKLISSYSNLSHPKLSVLTFSLVSDPNIIIYNSLFKSLSQNNLFKPTLIYFNQLVRTHLCPDEYTFTSILKACAGLESIKDGEIVHTHLFKLGFRTNAFVSNSLMDMYFKLGHANLARRLFDEMSVKDVVSYNIILSGYSNYGHVDLAREIFDSMHERTFVSWATMITAHCKLGDVGSARELFDNMTDRNVVSWNAMIAGYVQNEKFSEGIKLFRNMLHFGSLKPDEVTLVCALSACAHLGALDLGKWIEGYIGRRKMRLTLFLGNALSDMYAKCGCIDEARKVFYKMKERDIISWSVIVTAFAMHGLWEEAVGFFHEMLRQGVAPNDITFMGILSACTHGGLVDEGLEYFDRMSNEFGIVPKVEHYGCVVDLLSRAGRLQEAEDLICEMKVPPSAIVWGALLGGCRIYKDVDRGQRVAHRIIELDPTHSGSHVYLATLYNSIGNLEEAAKYILMMKEKGVVKNPGCSWIEIDNQVFEFFMGDRSNPQSGKIYDMISSLKARMKLGGYVPNISVVNQNINEEEKENAVAMHSEKLAVVFGLINTKEGMTVRVVKNLRVCSDCHDYMKVLSKIFERLIVLRDRNRFHHFKDGMCSCKDYW